MLGSCGIGVFRAFDRSSGETVWRYDITADGDQRSFHGQWLVAAKTVYAATDAGPDGHVYAWDLATGRVHWRYAAGREVPSSVARGDRNVFAVTRTDELLALDPATGRVRWTVRLDTLSARDRGNRFLSSPAVADGLVFVSGRDGVVRAFAETDGTVVWRHDLETRALASPVVHEGDVYVVILALHSRVVRLDAKTGTLTGAYRLGDAVAYTPVGSDAGLLLYGLGAGRPDRPGTLVLLDWSLGALRWSRASDAGWSTPAPFVMNGTVYVGDVTGGLRGYALADGDVLVATQLEGGAIRGIGGAGHELYVGTIGGAMHALRLPDR